MSIRKARRRFDRLLRWAMHWPTPNSPPCLERAYNRWARTSNHERYYRTRYRTQHHACVHWPGECVRTDGMHGGEP